MNPFVTEALAYLKDHWHVGMAGTSDAAYLLGINPNTFKTRLARGQALVMREANGEQRATLTFTGYHLVYNLITDRLLRYGFPVEPDESADIAPEPIVYAQKPTAFAEWAFNNILSTPHYTDAILRFQKDADGMMTGHVYEDGGVEEWTGDAALILPIGSMIVRLAATLHMRSASTHREHITRLVEAGLAQAN